MTLFFDNANFIKLFKLNAGQKRHFQGLLRLDAFSQNNDMQKIIRPGAGLLTKAVLD